MKKEHFEVLLEDIKSKFELIMEGHSALDEKFEKRFDALDGKIDNVQSSLNAHIEQNRKEHHLLQQMVSDVNKKIDPAQKEEIADLKRRVSRLEAA